MFLQITADSTPEPSGRTLQAEAEPVKLPDTYGTLVTEEGLSIQTLQPPAPDAAQVAAGQIRRARAALAARTRQIHGPLPMPPRKQLQRPASAAPEQLTGGCSADMLLLWSKLQAMHTSKPLSWHYIGLHGILPTSCTDMRHGPAHSEPYTVG